MRLDFEKMLNENGLKLGDKIHFVNDEKDDIYTITKKGNKFVLSLPNGFNSLFINALWLADFEIIKE